VRKANVAVISIFEYFVLLNFLVFLLCIISMTLYFLCVY